MSLGASGKYRLERRLGGGGMAEVFAGAAVGAEGFSRKVAIKRVLPGYSDHASFAQMFVAEAQISARLVHPNIVSVLDFDRDHDGRLFLVMELVDGKDLDALLATGLLPFPVVIHVVAEILRGLGFAHDLPAGSDVPGVVHRDISPHNVLLSWEGAVKVSDFGIAKARAASEASASALIKGKPAYMSPEQANGEALDGRSDLFAVGIVLWEMLVGERLFIAEDTRATLAKVLFHAIPRPRALRPDVPRDLDRVAMKLLERDLPARYATAEAAIADLMKCADAPRTGREAVAAVLAERFPDAVPIRHSAAARDHSAGDATAPWPGAIPPGTPTLTGAPSGPLPTFAPGPPRPPRPHGLRGLAGTTTEAAGAASRTWLAPALVTLALVIASAIVAFIAVTALRGSPTSAPRTDSSLGSATRTEARADTASAAKNSAATASAGARSAAATGSVVVVGSTAATGAATTVGSAAVAGSAAAVTVGSAAAATVGSAATTGSATTIGAAATTGAAAAVAGDRSHEADSRAPIISAPVAPHPLDAAPPIERDAQASQRGAMAVQSKHPGAERRTGLLRVVGIPSLTVAVDGKLFGDTPLTIPLKVGKHRVRLQNVEHTIDEVVSVTISEHQTTTIDRMPR